MNVVCLAFNTADWGKYQAVVFKFALEPQRLLLLCSGGTSFPRDQADGD